MPIYEYRCEVCGHEQENLLRRASAPTPACEGCGKESLKRLVSKTSFHLKGSGWYVTDYKNKSGAPGSESSAGDKSSSSEGKSESSSPAKAAPSKPSGSKAKPSASD